ncbi:hypothetical protein O3P69_013444 [Scylla paramamosain]|uniref:Uncharacterized protein n=1 Tax=Scylla paramamosain TaxID=85552 RepID=A0AAW0SAJ0_SCYPA
MRGRMSWMRGGLAKIGRPCIAWRGLGGSARRAKQPIKAPPRCITCRIRSREPTAPAIPPAASRRTKEHECFSE